MWQLAHRLALQSYRITRTFPRSEQYGLASQLRRAAVTIAANIAEGNARNHRREYVQFCHIARSSAVEYKCLLQLSRDLGLLPQDDFAPSFDLADQLSAYLYTMISKMETRND